MPAAILCYHSNNVEGSSYAENDHVALAADLAELRRRGTPIRSLSDVIDAVRGDCPFAEVDGAVAITFDDGSHFDWFDMQHPTHGLQRGFAGILREAALGAPASAFVIASPDARHQLDMRALIGRGWWTDCWWQAANQSGLMTIENHSHDHVHPSLDHVRQRDDARGDFARVDTFEDCQAQIAQASELIGRTSGRRPIAFAYPYGQSSNYAAEEWLPTFGEQHGLRAALTTSGALATAAADVWRIPRVVCGEHWQSPASFSELLDRL